MTKSHSKTKLAITIIALVVTLAIVGGVIAMQNRASDADLAVDMPETVTDDPVETPDEEPEEKPTEEVPEAEPSIDPELASSIDIEPMGITVYYVRGIPGFEFVVERSANGTEYVQFSSPDLAGTKCTDDDGVFASIIESPSSTEAQSLSATTEVDGVTYGLSLADSTCTSDPDLLEDYQESFADAFSLLSAMPADS